MHIRDGTLTMLFALRISTPDNTFEASWQKTFVQQPLGKPYFDFANALIFRVAVSVACELS